MPAASTADGGGSGAAASAASVLVNHGGVGIFDARAGARVGEAAPCICERLGCARPLIGRGALAGCVADWAGGGFWGGSRDQIGIFFLFWPFCASCVLCAAHV